MDVVSYLTINGETREIVDRDSRNEITLSQEQIEKLWNNVQYIATTLNINLPEQKN